MDRVSYQKTTLEKTSFRKRGKDFKRRPEMQKEEMCRKSR